MKKERAVFIFLVNIILQRLKFFAKNIIDIKNSQKGLFDLTKYLVEFRTTKAILQKFSSRVCR